MRKIKFYKFETSKSPVEEYFDSLTNKQFEKKRAKQDPKFWSGYDERLETFKLGLMLKQARLESGLTQEQIAKSLKTTKSVVSRMENHATDIRLSTLEKFAKAVGRKINVSLS